MRFDHVGVLVPDLEAAKAFARDVLGLGEPEREFEAPEHGLAGAFFSLEQGEVEFFTVEPGRDLGLDHVAVTVDDIEAERDRLAAQGVRFTGPGGPDEISEPIELRGAKHLWTVPETSGGCRYQLIQKP